MKINVSFVVALLSLAAAAKLAAQPQPGTVLWTYQAGNPIPSSPALGADGTVYLVSGLLTAITNSGSTASNKWSFPAGGAPAVGADGTIYSVSDGLYAINPAGSQKWFYPVVGANSHPAIGLDDTIYFVAQGRLYSISASGVKKWDYLLEFDSSHWSNVQSPVIGADGTIYIGVWNTFFAFTQDGTNKWSVSPNPFYFGSDSPAIEAETVYTSANGLYAFGFDGSNLGVLGNLDAVGSLVVGSGGMLYVAGSGRRLHAATQNGQSIWQVLDAPQYGASTTPAIGSGGRIYYCVSNTVWALNPQGQVQWSITTPDVSNPLGDVAITSPIIGPDGTLYAALGTTLYAIATGTNGPANSPWPMYRQNARHTGKVEKPALIQPKKRADANFQFQLYAQLGQTNLIETTTNLNTWTSLTSLVVTSVPMDVVDLSASNFPSRFYRTVSP